jgi:hypothetical protein
MLNGYASFELNTLFKLEHYVQFVAFYVHMKLAFFTQVKL